MTEDEIIDKINYMINNWHRNVVEIDIQWIQGLLDLYKQEKEKNKELSEELTERICKNVEAEVFEEMRLELKQEKEKNSKYIIHLTDEQYRKVIDNAQRDIEEKWKGKIREKIEELEDECDNSNAYDTTWYEASINTLTELLEEN